MARGLGNGRGKPVTTKTRLGRIITEQNVKLYVLCGQTNIYARRMTEYVQGRRVLTADHCAALCKALGCKPEDIIEPNLREHLTDATGMPKGGFKSVKDIPMTHLEPEPPKHIPTRPAHRPTVAPERIVRKVH